VPRGLQSCRLAPTLARLLDLGFEG